MTPLEPTLADQFQQLLQAGLSPEERTMEPVGSHGILDLGRSRRRRVAEAIFCQGKTTEQVVELARHLRDAGQTVLCTRLVPEQAEALTLALPDGHYDSLARVYWRLANEPTEDEKRVGHAGLAPVLVACAGTADMPVAREALCCLEAWRIPCRMIQDIGVAGLQRLVAAIPDLRSASVLVTVAGMEATLPTAVAGLVSAPVIGVPTSVGYGAHFQGLASLLSMINSCAGGLTVVNIDNGFGGAMAAALIIHQMAAAQASIIPSSRAEIVL
jgi:NCAIR mutase (PurE)-related protein